MKRIFVLVAVACLASLAACDGEDPDACPPSGRDLCDPVEDRCCPEGERCVLTYQSGSFGEACIGGSPEAGTSDPCQPSATSGAAACASGLVCLQVTGVDTEPVCHELCGSSADCSAGSCSQDLSGVSGVRACVAE